MMKFFRRNTKTMLAVFMALLLVVWLGGDALRSVMDRSKDYAGHVVGQAWGEPVKTGDLARINNQEEIGRQLIRSWSVPWYGILGRMANDPQLFQYLQTQGREPLSTEEWFLLDKEAQRNNVYVSQEEVSQLRSAMKPELLNAFRERTKVSIQQIDEALQAYLRVEEAAMRAANAVNVSEADIRDFVRDVAEKVKVDMVVVDPQKLIDKNYQPTDEELKAQFDKNKDKMPAGPGSYGYKLPEATQVEFVEVSVDALAAKQPVTDDEAYSYWSSHKTEFKKPATQPVSTQPATRPEQPKPYDTFTEAKGQVITKIQHDKAVSTANRLAEDLVRQLARPWVDQPATQPSGYKQPPASEMAADRYEKLVASYQDRYPGVLSYGRTKLATAEELSADPKIGRARAFAGTSQSVPFQTAAFMVAGLDAKKSEDPANTRLFRNVWETCAEPVSDATGNVYVFRNLAVRPSQPPASIDEVRGKVADDIRHMRAAADAEKVAKDLSEKAKKSGLKVAFQSDAELAKKLESNALVTPDPFSRQNLYPGRGGMPQVYGGFVPGVGYDPKLVEEAFALAGKVTTTQPSPVALHEDSRERWIVLEYKKTIPVTQEEYNKIRETARDYLLGQKRVVFVLNWFSPESIRERAKWEPAGGTPQKPEEKTAKAAS